MNEKHDNEASCQRVHSGQRSVLFLADEDVRLGVDHVVLARRSLKDGDQGVLLSGPGRIEFFGPASVGLLAEVSGDQIEKLEVVRHSGGRSALRIVSSVWRSGYLDLRFRSPWSFGLLPMTHATARETLAAISSDLQRSVMCQVADEIADEERS